MATNASVPDEVAEWRTGRRLGPSEQAEEAVRDAEADETEDRRRSAAAWPPWRSRTWVAKIPPTPNIETNASSSGMSDTPPIEVDDGAEDVVDEDRDQQQPATDQRADDEDEVLDRDVQHRASAGLPRWRDTPA